jgi:hypothetical protein
MADPLKNPGPILIDKVRGYFGALPEWLKAAIPIRTEKQSGIDSKITALDSPTAVESSLIQDKTDERTRVSRYLDSDPNDPSTQLPQTNCGKVVIPSTGQVADRCETVSNDPLTLIEGPPLQDGSIQSIGDIHIKQEITAPTFDKKAFQAQRPDTIPGEFRAKIPEKTTTHVVDGDAAMPTDPIGSDFMKREEQEKVGIKSVTTQSRDTTQGYPGLTGQKISPDHNGVPIRLSRSVVASSVGSTAHSQVFGEIDYSVTPLDPDQSVQESQGIFGAFPTINLSNYDPEINTKVLSKIQVVQQGAAYTPTTWQVLDYQERKIDAVHSLRIESVLEALPPPETTYSTQMITFPAILTALYFNLMPLAEAGRSEPWYQAAIRASFTVPVRLQTSTTYYTSAPAPSSLYVWKPTDIIYKGISYSINISNVLCDSMSAVGVTYYNDHLYGNTYDRFSIGATNPSATNYVNSIGTAHVISSEVSRYKRLWVKKDTYLTLQ